MKKRLLSISIILTIIIITGFEIFGLVTTSKLADDLKQESAAKSKQLAQQQTRETDIIYGYIYGYLMAENPKLITDELPEFTVLLIEDANDAGVDPYEIMILFQKENGFNLYKPGTKGERGPGQVMKNTWNLYAAKMGFKPEDFYQWRCNMKVAIYHYAALKRKHHGNITEAAGEYNGGTNWAKITNAVLYAKRFERANSGITRLRNRKIVQ